MESRGRLILMLIAGLLVVFAALAVYSRMSTTPESPPVEEKAQTPRVMIAKHDLAPGSYIQAAADLDWGAPPPPVPEESAQANPQANDQAGAAAPAASDNGAPPDNAAAPAPTPPPAHESYLHEGAVRLEDFNGSIVRRQLHAGEPVPASALLKAGEGGLMSAVLDPGMRAVSISVNAQSGNAGFVLPGDYVDLVVTSDVSHNGHEGETHRSVYSKTFIENVRVLAADQTLENPDNKALLAKTITVEVTPKQAQMIAVAAELGKISIALRSAIKMQDPSEKKNHADDIAISDRDMEVTPSTPEASQQVKVFRPKETQSLEFNKTEDNNGGNHP